MELLVEKKQPEVENATTESLHHKDIIQCEAFHPVDGEDCPTVLSFKLPPIPEESAAAVEQRMQAARLVRQHNYHICLDTSGSMCFSMSVAKAAVEQLIDHLLTVCKAEQHEITLYCYSNECQKMPLSAGGRFDWRQKSWFNAINAYGGTNFASVFVALGADITERKNHATSNHFKEMESTIFFFTDGRDGYSPRVLNAEREKLEVLIKHTPGTQSTIHSFGFTSGHDARLLSWLTQCGTEQGCFQFIESADGIGNAMMTTLNLLTHVAKAPKRELEFRFRGEDEWVCVKSEDGQTATFVVRDRSLKSKAEATITTTDQSGDNSTEDKEEEGDLTMQVREIQTAVVKTEAGVEEQRRPLETVELTLGWVEEMSKTRITAFASFVQHELLRLVEQVNTILTARHQGQQQREELRVIDEHTMALARSLGVASSAAARMKKKKKEQRGDRDECMALCARTKSLLQSFLTLKAEAHKGTVSNLSLANFNSLAYGQITQARLKAKLDARAGKNITAFQKMDEEIEEIVNGLDLEAMAAAETEERKRELSCAFSTQTYIEALEEHDCICLTFDVGRSPAAIADSSQLTIKSIGPTYITGSMYTEALQYSLGVTDFPEEVHGGFDRANEANVVGGLARENITAVMPLYINANHWKVAKLRMKPILGYVVTLDPTGYAYSQMTTVPFLLLIKSLEAKPLSDFRQRQFKLILETCDAIYQDSTALRASTKRMVEQFCESHIYRTVDVIQNMYVFLGHVICARRAGDISADDIQRLMGQGRLEAVAVEEQIRRDMSWRVDESLVGSIFSWLSVDRVRDIQQPEERYRKAYARYVARQEEAQTKDAQNLEQYRRIFRSAQTAQGLATVEAVETEVRELDLLAVTSNPSSAPSQQQQQQQQQEDESSEPPVFEKATLDIHAFELSEPSKARLQSILNAVSTCVDKVLRLLTVLQAPSDDELDTVLSLHLAPVGPPNLASVFFARYSEKTLLATMLQAFAHTKNADRRTVHHLMAPLDDAGALEYLDMLYRTKMDNVVGEIVGRVLQMYTESQMSKLKVLFKSTGDLEIAAGILLTCKARGGEGGPFAAACITEEMELARPKIQMILNGTYKDVVLFSDHYEKGASRLVWHPRRQLLYRMWQLYHGLFRLHEWDTFNPRVSGEYFALRYIFDGHMDELNPEETEQVVQVFVSTYGHPPKW